MIKLLKDSWTLTTNNLIIAYPLIFFFWLFAMLMPALQGSNLHSPKFAMIALNIIGLFIAFASGWFAMFAKVAQNYKDDPKIVEKKEYSFVLLKEFLPGVGRGFLPFLGASILYFLLFAAMVALIFVIGVKFIGVPSNVPADYMSMISNKQALLEFQHSLSKVDMLKYVKWNILYLFFGNIFTILTMFWAPFMLLCTLNPLKAFWMNLKLLFKKPAQVLLLFVIYISINTLLSLFSLFVGTNFLLQLVLMTLMFLFMLYFLMLLFVFVEDNNENTRSCRLDSVG